MENVPSVNMEGEGIMSYTAASQQGEPLKLKTCLFLLSSIFIAAHSVVNHSIIAVFGLSGCPAPSATWQ